MPKIRVLSDTLASQVAAGEVVERPASVVKELVENSIDAGAREITVDIDQGGAALIRVQDDGCGMSREDALLSLERHATSKLREAADLAAIRTLGFRGEAIPSIASVSRFRLVTREADAVVGTEIIVNGGKLSDVRDAGCAPGTTIEAKALFFNVPARKKFMRAESTESAHVEHQMQLHALAAPGVRFRLRRNQRPVFDWPAVDKAVDRVRQMLGVELSRELMTIEPASGNGISLYGFLLPARHARKGRRHQFVLLNGRPVEDAIISRALAEGFRGAVSDGLHPAAWLWVDMDPALVDVNVHPAKREVRFHRPADLKNLLVQAVSAALAPAAVIRPPTNPPPAIAPTDTVPTPAIAPRIHSLPAVQKPLLGWQLAEQRMPAENTASSAESIAAAPPSPVAAPVMPAFRIIGLLHQRYVLLESDDGLVVLDPKAARERILYERMTASRGEAGESQPLLVPILLDLDPRDADLLLRQSEALASAGIELESFGGNTVQIRSLPACLHLPDARSLIGHLLDELLHESVQGALRFAAERMARLCARHAVAGTDIRLEQVMPLLRELFNCDLPYCTADGRPTLSEWSLSDLERRFSGRGS